MLTPVPDWYFRAYSGDRAKREAVVWKKLEHAKCGKCGKEAMVGHLDGDAILLACTYCGHTSGVSFREQ